VAIQFFLVIFLAIVVGGVVGLSIRRRILRTLRCPQCGTQPALFRMPKNWEQFVWGGWTCSTCGSEVNAQGKLRMESPPLRPVSSAVAVSLTILMLASAVLDLWILLVQPPGLVPYQEYVGSLLFGFLLLSNGLITHPINAAKFKQTASSRAGSWLASKMARQIIILAGSLLLVIGTVGSLLTALVR
jgi:hypothetical protein